LKQKAEENQRAAEFLITLLKNRGLWRRGRVSVFVRRGGGRVRR